MAMVKHASMGRQAEMGPTWMPAALQSRAIARLLTERRQGNDQPDNLDRCSESDPPRPLSSMGSARSPADCMLPNIAKPQSKQRVRVSIEGIPRDPGPMWSIASKPCLYYHPYAGRAELTRLIAAAGEIELEEKAVVENIASF